MNNNVKAGISAYHASATKYIVFTICAVVLIRVIQNVILSLAKDNNFREKASKAIESGGKVYDAFKDIQPPHKVFRR